MGLVAVRRPGVVPTDAERKLTELSQRVISEIDERRSLELMEKDGRLRSLHSQKLKAIQDKKFFQCAIIERQIEARLQEILCEEAGRRIQRMCETSEIDLYLCDEDKQKIVAAKAKTYILLDTLDTVLNDLKGVYESCGLTPDELYMQRKVSETRKWLDQWFQTHKMHDTDYEEATRQEADRLYTQLAPRIDILHRKLYRIQDREQKQKTSAKKNGNSSKENRTT